MPITEEKNQSVPDGAADQKIVRLLGLAMRSRSLLLGVDNVRGARRRVYAVFVDETLGENSLAALRRCCATKHIPLIRSAVLIEDIVFKKNCKAIGLTEGNMFEGIERELDSARGFGRMIGGMAD